MKRVKLSLVLGVLAPFQRLQSRVSICCTLICTKPPVHTLRSQPGSLWIHREHSKATAVLSSEAHSSSQTSKNAKKKKKLENGGRLSKFCDEFHINMCKCMILPHCNTEIEREFSFVDAQNTKRPSQSVGRTSVKVATFKLYTFILQDRRA